MVVQHGDILVTSCESIKIPCQHQAIVFLECGQWWVFQNTPSKFNAWGGNIVMQPLDEFLSERQVRQVINAKMDIDCLKQYNHENRFNKWDVLKYNCEDYVNEAAKGQRFSQLRQSYLVAGVFGALLLFA